MILYRENVQYYISSFPTLLGNVMTAQYISFHQEIKIQISSDIKIFYFLTHCLKQIEKNRNTKYQYTDFY